MSGPLAIIPSFVRKEKELGVTITTIDTLRKYEPDLEIQVVDDCSPVPELADMLFRYCEELDGVDCWLADSNEGFSRTVNIGLERALEEGRDAILVNADVEFTQPIVEAFQASVGPDGEPAAVAGALLLYPSGMIQHAGVYLDFLDRAFDHRFRYGPGALPEAHVPHVCPVTGALQFIRHETLKTIGVYDDEYRMGFEDVDYCLRAFDAGLTCVYNPRVRAIHHESLFRGQRSELLDSWHQASLQLLHTRHGGSSLGRFVPAIA